MTKFKTMRAVWLGQALKEIRESAKLTTKQVGDHVSKDGSTISRMENGEVPVPQHILDGILEVCDLTDSHRRSDLDIIRKDTAQGGWWDGYKRDVVATLIDRAWMESKAATIRSFEITSLPGLLQLPEYAEALMRASIPEVTDPEINRWVDMRMQRQHIISKHRPVELCSIIDEQLLRRLAGPPCAMKNQLDYLVEVGHRRNVEIRILPADRCFGVSGSFELFGLTDPYPDVAYVATPAGDLCIEDETLADLVRAYDRLCEASLSAERSRRLIESERDKL